MLVVKRFKSLFLITALFLLAVFCVSSNANAAGMSVGNSSLLLNSGENIYYGVTSASNTNGNFLLLEKGAGNTVFKIDYAGNITTNGNLLGSNSYWSASGNNLFAASTYNIGIGTSDAGAYKLNVAGNIAWSGGDSSHLGTGANVTTYVGNSSVNNAIMRSNDNTHDAWLMNWGDSPNWGIYNRNIDSDLAVAGAITVPANSTAFIGNGLARAYINHANGNAGFTGTVYAGNFSGPLSGTLNSANVSSGSFGSNTGGGDYSFPGNVSASGLLTEKKVTFMPTAVGWYRLTAMSSQGGTVRISASYDNTATDVELQYYVGAWGVDGSIQETRYSSYNNGAVSQARISEDGSGTAYLDIYVSTATAPAPITVYGYGPNMPSFIANPVVGAVAGSTHLRTLTLGAGFRSTSGANFAEAIGNVGIGTNNPGYKLDVQGGDARILANLLIGSGSGANQNMGVYYGSTASDYGAIRFFSGGSNLNTIHSFSNSWGGNFHTASMGALNLTGYNGTTIGDWNDPDASIGNGTYAYLKNSVGIGIVDPGVYKLNVNGPTNISGALNVTGAITASGITGITVGASNVSSGEFATNTGGGNFIFGSTVTGNVGIGKSPTDPIKLDVSGRVQFDKSGTYTNYSWAGGELQTNSVEILDRVGGSTSDGVYPTLTFHDYGNGGAQFSMEGLTTTLHLGSGNSNSAGTLATTGSYFSKLKIWGGLETTGSVGIGTALSGYKLDVNGNTNITGALNVTSLITASSINIIPGDGNGLKFWSSDSYKISMGVGGLYQYGPVTDYSIKTQMDAGSPGRGFTWGREGITPIAALNSTSGDMKIAGIMTAASFSGSYSGTINAANVSSGAFGSNTSGGNFSFPANVDVGGNITINRDNVFGPTNGNLTLYHPTSGGASSIVFPSRSNYSSDFGYITYYDDNNTYAYWGDSGENSALVIGNENDENNAVSDVIVLKPSASTIIDSPLIVNGNVGIGTTDPQAPLNIYKAPTSGFVEQLRIGGTGNYRSLDFGTYGAYGGYMSTYGNDMYILSGRGVSSENHSIHFYTSFNGANGQAENNERMTILWNGNVGINTTDPGAYKLKVVGDTNITGTVTAGALSGPLSGTLNAANVSSGIFGANTSGGTYSFGGITPNGISHYQWEGATYRDPGTYAPQVNIRQDSSSTGINSFKPALTLYNNDGAQNTTVGLDFASSEGNPGTGNSVTLAGIMAVKESAGTVGAWSQGGLNFYVKNYGTRVDAMYINSSGNIGIGTLIPYGRITAVNADHAYAGVFLANIGAGVGGIAIKPGSDANRIHTEWWGVANDVPILIGTYYHQDTMLSLNPNGNVGIGIIDPGAYKLNVNGDTNVSGALNITGGANISGDLTMSSSQITVNKLKVNTIDPLYNIKGTNYASFAASIVGGVKEEVMGKLNLTTKVGDEYQAVINFDTEKEGTDLWVWHKVIDFNKDNVEAFITPYGNFANTYYYISGNSLIFKSDRPTEISYRLIAKRFDWRKWPTLPTDQTEEAGMIIK